MGRFLALTGLPSRAECRDVLCESASGAARAAEVDVVLLMKMLPCLEQKDRACGLKTLEGLAARFVVVTYPVRSIGRRGAPKNMSAHYAAGMSALLARTPWTAQRVECEDELIFVLDKSPK